MLYEQERSAKTEYLYHQEDENLQFQPHVHYSFEVVFVLEGRLICQVDNESYTLQKNDVLLILPGQIHSYQTPTYSQSYLCVFSNDYVDHFYQTVKGQKLSNPVYQMENSLHTTQKLQQAKSHFSKQAVLYQLCAIPFEQSKLTPIEATNFVLSNLIVFYVQNNFTKEISLRELAKEQGYNYTYLSHFFNQTFHQKFPAYVNQFRAQHAARLLKNTNKTITQIVTDSGFSTIRNFNTVFKSIYGVTPKEYRLQKQKS